MTAITLKKIDSEILSFTTNRNKLRDQAQVIAMMIFYHAAPKEVSSDCMGSGDCTRAIKLAKAMPKSWAAMLVSWFRANTPIRIVLANEKCEYDPKYKKLEKEERLSWWKLEEANETPWFEFETEPDVQVKIFSLEDLVKMASQLSVRIEKILNDEDDRRVIKPEDKASGLAFVRQLEGLKVERIKEPANANEQDEKKPEEQAA